LKIFYGNGLTNILFKPHEFSQCQLTSFKEPSSKTLATQVALAKQFALAKPSLNRRPEKKAKPKQSFNKKKQKANPSNTL